MEGQKVKSDGLTAIYVRVSTEEQAQSVAARYRVRYVDLRQTDPDYSLVERLPVDFLVRNRARFPFQQLVSDRYPLEKINEAFAACEWHGKDAGKITRAALVP